MIGSVLFGGFERFETQALYHLSAWEGHTIYGDRPGIETKPHVWTDDIRTDMISVSVQLLVSER